MSPFINQKYNPRLTNRGFFLLIFVFLIQLFFITFSYAESNDKSIQQIKDRGYLLWGADAGGGAPYIFPDPENPKNIIGFEVDIANLIAKKLGVKAKHVQNVWDNLIPSLERKDVDMVMNGIEITPARKERILFSKPYYIYTEQLVVRKNETRIKNLEDLRGKKAGTLSATTAQNILEGVGGINVKIYPGQVEPYEDLSLGRIDAVLLDLPIASFYAKSNPKLRYEGEPLGEGEYGIAIRKNDKELKKVVDDILYDLLMNGELKKIYLKWDLWNKKQEKLFKIMAKSDENSEFAKSKLPIYKFLPMLLKGALVTILLSVSSMTFAIILGLTLTLARMYGNKFLKFFAAAYVEVYRGTPLLIQLYILYYGLPNIGITLNPVLAGFLGLGMNYAAYESEIYRGGINSVPRGQMEAALSLGMTRILAIRRIIIPQALKVTLPPVTNDFIALFKDSSLVSIITMVELTKTYNILSSSTMRFLELGLVVAFLYFGMSYPLSLFAKKLEKIAKRGHRV